MLFRSVSLSERQTLQSLQCPGHEPVSLIHRQVSARNLSPLALESPVLTRPGCKAKLRKQDCEVWEVDSQLCPIKTAILVTRGLFVLIVCIISFWRQSSRLLEGVVHEHDSSNDPVTLRCDNTDLYQFSDDARLRCEVIYVQ